MSRPDSNAEVTLYSTYQPTLPVETCSRAELVEQLSRIAADVEMVKTLQCAIGLVCDTARGGAFVILAPVESFTSVFSMDSSLNLKTRSQPAVLRASDGGYMTERLKGRHISEPCFADAFGDFTEHSDTDRWPHDHPDVDARGMPKDGALLLNEKGYCVKCAAKIVGLRPPALWSSVGTRHEAALACAWAIPNSVVLIRSDGGTIHGLARQEDNIAAYQLLAKAEAHAGTPLAPVIG